MKDYISQRLQELEDAKIAEQKEVLQYLTLVLRGESRSPEIVLEGTGYGQSKASLINKPPSEKEKIKAAELLGKRYGTWVEHVELDADIKTVVVDDLEYDS